eukprot:SAG25_NODE_33_length_20262_cov_33.203293_17_plen_99_part_00
MHQLTVQVWLARKRLRRGAHAWANTPRATGSHLCACIGSPCLRQCVHGAPIASLAELLRTAKHGQPAAALRRGDRAALARQPCTRHHLGAAAAAAQVN